MAIEDRYLKENPCKYYRKFAEDGYRRALTKEELQRILESAKKIQEKPKSKLQSIIYDLIVFSLNTGMRLSEILNLKRDYIKDGIIFYPITETKYRSRVYSPNKKFKVICLNSIAIGIIGKQKGEDFIFPLKRRNPNVIRKTMAKIRKASGVKDFTFHQLRHTVSTVISSQVSLATAKTILGHADIKTTLKYTHPEIEEQKKGVAKIEQYFKSLSGK
jgi:integrase